MAHDPGYSLLTENDLLDIELRNKDNFDVKRLLLDREIFAIELGRDIAKLQNEFNDLIRKLNDCYGDWDLE
jgi:hypothetical protein